MQPIMQSDGTDDGSGTDDGDVALLRLRKFLSMVDCESYLTFLLNFRYIFGAHCAHSLANRHSCLAAANEA